jgi:two-component system, cell cycle response regulator
MDLAKVGPPSDVRVLVVEDDDDSRDAIVGLLRGMFGVWAQGARDGLEAFELLSGIRPDLILCDLQMPRLDGFAFIRRLRSDPQFRGILTIAVTGLARPLDIAATRDAGFDGHVSKPIRAEMLARLLDRARHARGADPPQGVA